MSHGSRYVRATLLTLGLVAVVAPRLLSQSAVPPWPYGYLVLLPQERMRQPARIRSALSAVHVPRLLYLMTGSCESCPGPIVRLHVISRISITVLPTGTPATTPQCPPSSRTVASKTAYARVRSVTIRMAKAKWRTRQLQVSQKGTSGSSSQISRTGCVGVPILEKPIPTR